ncbi:MAG: exodeoxyribonuclease VII small subunit [Chloroflexia bacterium]
MAANSNKVGAHGENGASFEESFARLQEVVAELSAGNLSLQEALGAFEEGMLLADKCARMLDEAELRVKQVSDRAMRAGSASLVDLDEAIRAVPTSLSGEAYVLEVETYEATIVQGPGTRDQGSGPARAGSPDQGKPQNARPYPQPLLDELDPLFDEED